MIKNDQRGFTLIEAVAVIGVLAVTSAVLIVNNRLNELQLSLNTDIAGVTNAVSRAKALTLQGVGEGICGYGVSFAQGIAGEGGANNNPDTYSVNSYTNCDDLSDPSGRATLADQGGENNLSSGLRLVTVTSSDTNYFVKDLLFYSSDARVKLIGVNNNEIKTAGVVIISTESMPTSFMTLKITATGQVTSRAGAYVTPYNFDNGIESNLTRGGATSGDFTGAEDTKPGTGTIGDKEGNLNNNEPGITDEGSNPGLACVPVSCNGKTCADFNGCGSPCVVCPAGQFCINKACTSCIPSCTGKVCGADNGCGGFCTGCPAGETCNLASIPKQCVGGGIELRIDSIDPPIGVK